MEDIKGLGIAEPLAEMLEILYQHPCAHEAGDPETLFDKLQLRDPDPLLACTMLYPSYPCA